MSLSPVLFPLYLDSATPSHLGSRGGPQSPSITVNTQALSIMELEARGAWREEQVGSGLFP